MTAQVVEIQALCSSSRGAEAYRLTSETTTWLDKLNSQRRVERAGSEIYGNKVRSRWNVSGSKPMQEEEKKQPKGPLVVLLTGFVLQSMSG